MKLKQLFTVIGASALLVSCVSTKKFKESEAKYVQLSGSYLDMQEKYRALQDEVKAIQAQLDKSKSANAELTARKKALEEQIAGLNDQVEYLRKNSSTAMEQLKDLSVITGAQAESIKKSLENIGAKDSYIQTLQGSMARKDSMNMALVMNLKGAIGDLSDGDINIKVEKGVVYVDISDKLLFKSGSFSITDKATVVLGKVAKVLAAQPNIEFMVEGHTDSKQLLGSDNKMEDNWDLSVKRATTIVRLLQEKYGIDPKRMTAAGRGEYVPVAENNSAENRAANRRTRIVILPQLDQFFKLLENK